MEVESTIDVKTPVRVLGIVTGWETESVDHLKEWGHSTFYKMIVRKIWEVVKVP